MFMNTFLYTAATILFVSFLIIGIYMLAMNSKYDKYVSIFNIEKTTFSMLLAFASFAYLFASGWLLEMVPKILSSVVFLACLAGSIAMALIICRILHSSKRELIMYGNLLKADAEVCRKSVAAQKSLQELKTCNKNEIIASEIAQYEQMIQRLHKIHTELQAQKVVFNASFSTKEMKSVMMADTNAVNSNIMYELDKIKSNKALTQNLSDAKAIMRKYGL